jgi:hypothetical protein
MAFSATDRTVAPDMNFESCSTWLTRSRFRNAISPSSGVSSAAKIRNKVDLPEPFGPMRPMRSPAVTVNETFWKRGLAPKAFEIPCALMIGGNGLRSPNGTRENGLGKIQNQAKESGSQLFFSFALSGLCRFPFWRRFAAVRDDFG